jgi:trans-2,3-dihydro-3-hydroxyanthranilate isomerase
MPAKAGMTQLLEQPPGHMRARAGAATVRDQRSDMRKQFYTLDVFTQERFAGNPLAVVGDADDLDDARMQAIAREFNLSETVFLQSPRDPVNTARARIFTPKRELPFAGHPTIGTAVLIGLLQAADMIRARDIDIVLEEAVGPVRCTVRARGDVVRAEFELPRLPERAGEAADAAMLARALSLSLQDIGFRDHKPSVWSAGVGFTFVPLASRDAVTRARPDMSVWNEVMGPPDHPSAFVYCDDTVGEGRHVHARMFAPSLGIAEDPATGSAVASFAGVCMEYEKPGDGEHQIIVEQGFAMGRPSLIALGMRVEGGKLVSATIGGAAVLVSEGAIEI